MRLWHKELIPILPRMQLVGQWRECCSIARSIEILGKPNHILVNKIMEYPIEHFATYCHLVKWWMGKYGYSPSKETELRISNCIRKSITDHVPYDFLFEGWHNDRYLFQCVSNLEEKYDCGGIPKEEWEPIEDYILDRL